jgi:hypothetical protein
MTRIYLYRIHTRSYNHPMPLVYMVVSEDLVTEVLRLTDNGHTIIKVELINHG